MKLPRQLTHRILPVFFLGACFIAAPDLADAKDKGKGNGGGKGNSGKVKVGGHQLVKKAVKSGGGNFDRGASAFTPGRSGNLPPGHGGVPPGQLKKAVNGGADLQRYLAVPRSDYGLTYGSGYAGNGYYWAPRGMPYFYEGPGVNYYPSRNLIPQQYRPSNFDSGYGSESEVQSALASRGYYHGQIDGSIGTGSREAIARYQADHGLPVTGRIDGGLLNSLGLY